MWDKSQPTRRPIASVSLISLISLKTVLRAWYCPVLAVENCFKHSAVILPGLLDGSWLSCPPSPISYTLQTICLFLHSTSSLLSPITSSSHAFGPTSYECGLLSAYPLPLLSSSALKTTIYLLFSFWDNFCTDSRDLFIASRSCSGLLMVSGFFSFSLSYPTNLHAFCLLLHSFISLFTLPYTFFPTLYLNVSFL